MRLATPVDARGNSWPAWGRAHWIAVATVEEDDRDAAQASWRITEWQVHEVGWDESHDLAGEGAHHARIVRFLRENQIGAIVVDHVGPGMQRMLATMGIPLLPATPGDARASVEAALAAQAG